jgi:hypothetical protein
MTEGYDCKPIVELHQAFHWICDACGRDNFERAITVDPASIDAEDLPIEDPDRAEAIRDWINNAGEGDFVQAPEDVTCLHCGAEFATEDH